MPITGIDELVDAMANNSSRLILDKPSISNTAAPQFHSLWKSAGQPAIGLNPTTAEACNMATQGALQFTPQVAPSKGSVAQIR